MGRSVLCFGYLILFYSLVSFALTAEANTPAFEPSFSLPCWRTEQ